MLYLNIEGFDDSENRWNLTLTSVVFESSILSFSFNCTTDLTLTSVVFE